MLGVQHISLHDIAVSLSKRGVCVLEEELLGVLHLARHARHLVRGITHPTRVALLAHDHPTRAVDLSAEVLGEHIAAAGAGVVGSDGLTGGVHGGRLVVSWVAVWVAVLGGGFNTTMAFNFSALRHNWLYVCLVVYRLSPGDTPRLSSSWMSRSLRLIALRVLVLGIAKMALRALGGIGAVALVGLK